MRAAAAEKETAIASPTPLSVNDGAKETKETHVDSHARGAGIGTEKIIEIHEFLRKCDSAEEAKKYLSEQKLTVPDLKKVAKHDGLSYPLDRKKEDIIDSIARDTVGFRLQNASIVNYRNDEDTAKNAARQEMGTQSFIIKASHATPGTHNGKVVAVVENDSNILFVQQLAGDKSLGVVYRMDLEDIPPGLNITLGANLSITKDRDGNITVKALEERGRDRDKGMER